MSIKVLLMCLLFGLCTVLTVFGSAQEGGKDVRRRPDSDRTKEAKRPDERKVTEMKSAEKKSGSNFYAEQKNPPKSASELKASKYRAGFLDRKSSVKEDFNKKANPPSPPPDNGSGGKQGGGDKGTPRRDGPKPPTFPGPK